MDFKIGDYICFKTGNIKDVVKIDSKVVTRSNVKYIQFLFKKKGRKRDIAIDLIRHAKPIEQKLGFRIDG